MASEVVGIVLGVGKTATSVFAAALGAVLPVGAVATTAGTFAVASPVVGCAGLTGAAGAKLDALSGSLDGAGAGATGASGEDEVALTSISALASFGAACAEIGTRSNTPSEQQQCNNCE